MTRGLVSVFALLVTGAGCETEVSLADLGPSLHFFGTHEALLGTISFARALPDCAVFDSSFRATVNGAPVHIDWPYVSTSSYCLEPELDFDFEDPPTDGTATFVLADDSMTITAKLGDHYLPRTFSIESGEPIVKGTTVTLRWSHPSDLSQYLPRVAFVANDTLRWITDDITIDGDLISFEVPAMGGPGAYSSVLEVYMRTDNMTVPCTNAECTIFDAPSAAEAVSVVQ
jgi:hypothetical protein